ncbi:Meckel syndrome type 1 [Chionoecetes opilio]|uniref:Meckel syndrome type 1 n=1 Tax=Chionoecetes opilio TaxID=41210 RepID=A0A8J4XP00_CHIOP|nr:Meckel syndrome type 1 [Chionoecetes opilio]
MNFCYTAYPIWPPQSPCPGGANCKGWPLLLLAAFSLDWFGHDRDEGYAAFALPAPALPGQHRDDGLHRVGTWRPAQVSPIGRMRRFFLGGCQLITDPSYLAVGVQTSSQVEIPDRRTSTGGIYKNCFQMPDQWRFGQSYQHKRVQGGIIIFAESLEVLVMALEALHKEAKPLGLEVSWLKTKVQVFGDLLDEAVQSVHACGEDIEILESFTYLGSAVHNDVSGLPQVGRVSRLGFNTCSSGTVEVRASTVAQADFIEKDFQAPLEMPPGWQLSTIAVIDAFNKSRQKLRAAKQGLL